MADFTKINLTRLNESNYFTWKYRMELYLTKDGLWDVVNEDKPENPDNTWKKKDQEARILIGLAVEDSQLNLVRNVSTARDMWLNIKGYYMKSNLSNKVRIIRKICSTKMEEGGNLEKHIQKLNDLFQQLNDMGEEKVSNMWSVSFILSSLPESYNSLVTALETRKEEELTLGLVQSKLLAEYERKMTQRSGADESVLKVGQRQSTFSCYFCKEPNHIRRNCVKFKEWKEKYGNSGNSQSAKVIHGNKNEEEYLFATGMSSEGWIVDSGATSHMSNKKNLFHEIDEKFKDKIKLANGDLLNVEGKGSVKMRLINSEKEVITATFTEVLYVPEIDGSLLSVRSLARKGLDIKFENDIFRILKDGKELAIGDCLEDIFKLRKVSENWSEVKTHPGLKNYEVNEKNRVKKSRKARNKQKMLKNLDNMAVNATEDSREAEDIAIQIEKLSEETEEKMKIQENINLNAPTINKKEEEKKTRINFLKKKWKGLKEWNAKFVKKISNSSKENGDVDKNYCVKQRIHDCNVGPSNLMFDNFGYQFKSIKEG